MLLVILISQYRAHVPLLIELYPFILPTRARNIFHIMIAKHFYFAVSTLKPLEQPKDGQGVTENDMTPMADENILGTRLVPGLQVKQGKTIRTGLRSYEPQQISTNHPHHISPLAISGKN